MALKDRFRSSVSDAVGRQGTLRRQTVEGVFWTAAGTVFSKAVSFVKTIILARLLAPEDFGLFGAALAVLGALQVFTETGASALLVHKTDVDDRYWNTGWVIGILRGAGIFLIIWACSTLIAGFYGRPGLNAILKVLAFSFLLQGFNNVGLIRLQKEMRFKRRVALDQLAELIGNLSAIGFGIAFRSVWALVLGKIVASAAMLALSHLFLKYRPGLHFDRQAARDFVSFGKSVFAFSVLVYLITSVDDIIVGKVLGMAMLGHYTMAYGLANIPTTHISRTIARVVFPAYSKMQEDTERLQSGFISVFFYTTLAVVPASLGLAAVAPEFTRVVLDDRWIPMIPALQILCFLGLFRGVASIIGPLILGYGRPDYLRNMKLIEFSIFALFIYPVIRFGGLVGVSLFTTGIYALSLALSIRYVRKILPGATGPVLRIVGMVLPGGGLMLAGVLAARRWVFPEANWPSLAALVLIGVAIYLPLAVLMNRRYSQGLVAGN
jgi:PST family polysaccharide transporter/lipopolysaccharide exporter